MGYEYNIKYHPNDIERWESFVATLSNPLSNGWKAFDIRLTEDGVYFCDYGHTEVAAIAFRRIIDQAISEAESVTIQEL